MKLSHVQSRSLNCSNCGAALAAADIVCPHCLSRNAVDLMAMRQFRLLEPQSEAPCPNCKTPLTLIALDDFNAVASHCAECKGLFLGPGMLDVILQRIGSQVLEINHDRLQAIHTVLLKRENVVYRQCPTCHAMMWRKAAIKGCGVISDQCREHGVWLDAGELTVMAEWLEAGGQLRHEQDEKIAAQLDKVAIPKPYVPEPPQNPNAPMLTALQQASPTQIGYVLSAIAALIVLDSAHWLYAVLALGVVTLAARFSAFWFTGLVFLVSVLLYRGSHIAWPPALALLIFIVVMLGAVVAYRQRHE